jgi:hypothetical protein
MAPLKLIAGPQGPIVQVAARLRLLQEPASVENSIVSLKPEMSVNLPMQLRARPVSNKSRLAIACGPDQRSRDRVDSVEDIFSPLKNPVDRCSYVVRKCCFDTRMDVNEVNWTGARCSQDSKVVPLRKEGIEGTQGFRTWIISARDVRLCAEPRFQPNRWKSIACFGRNRPCPDVSGAECAELPEAFVIKIQSRRFR